MNPSIPTRGRARILPVGEAAALLGSGQLSVIDARAEPDFREGHLPGSQRMDWRDWTEERPGLMHYVLGHPERWGRVPKADAHLEARLRVIGLSNARPILVVGEPHAWGEEGRIAWNLLFWGADDVALLDGGFPAWAEAGRPVEVGAPVSVPRGDFVVTPRRERLADLADVKNALAARDTVILDARNEAEWRGELLKAQKRGGHLPGAKLVPHPDLYTKDGRFIDALTLEARVGALAPAASPITYCVGGVRSALLAVVLEARLGRPVRNYAGSLWEYAAAEELPLE